MGKHIKTEMDYAMIRDLGREVAKVNPNNEVLQKYLSMDNFEGSELRKDLKDLIPKETAEGIA